MENSRGCEDVTTQAIVENARSTEILDEVDVLVAGGGMAGAFAAIAAARAGASTILVEREGVLGGVATATLMSSIGNMILSGEGEPVVKGIAWELIQKLVRYGAVSPDWMSSDVPGITLDSEWLKVVLAEMALDSGVKVLTHAYVTEPIMDGNVACGAIIESKAGRQAILAKVTIDCTGDADLAVAAGAPYGAMKDGNASLLFKLGRVDLDRLHRHFRKHPDSFPDMCDSTRDFAQFERAWLDHGIWFFPHWGGKKWDIFQNAIKSGEFVAEAGVVKHMDVCGMYAVRGTDSVVINSNYVDIDGTCFDAADLGLKELKLQKSCYYVADFMKRHVPGFGDSILSQIGHAMGIRCSRWILGESSVKRSDVDNNDGMSVIRPDAVGCLPCRDHAGHTGSWYRNYTFDIPLGCMMPKKVENLLVASGKSVFTEPAGIIRGMSYCMVFGQGAGVAAAVAARKGKTVRDVSIREIQHVLLEQGVNLGDDAMLRKRGLMVHVAQ